MEHAYYICVSALCQYCNFSIVAWCAGIFCRQELLSCPLWTRCVCLACECSSTVSLTKPTNFLKRWTHCFAIVVVLGFNVSYSCSAKRCLFLNCDCYNPVTLHQLQLAWLHVLLSVLDLTVLRRDYDVGLRPRAIYSKSFGPQIWILRDTNLLQTNHALLAEARWKGCCDKYKCAHHWLPPHWLQ